MNKVFFRFFVGFHKGITGSPGSFFRIPLEAGGKRCYTGSIQDRGADATMLREPAGCDRRGKQFRRTVRPGVAARWGRGEYLRDCPQNLCGGAICLQWLSRHAAVGIAGGGLLLRRRSFFHPLFRVPAPGKAPCRRAGPELFFQEGKQNEI